jgi:hypothetical protein
LPDNLKAYVKIVLYSAIDGVSITLIIVPVDRKSTMKPKTKPISIRADLVHHDRYMHLPDNLKAYVKTVLYAAIDAVSIPVDKVSVDKVPAGKVSVDKVPAGKVSVDKVPAGKVPVDKVPASKVPVDKVPAGKVPAGKVPASKVSVDKVPAGKEIVDPMLAVYERNPPLGLLAVHMVHQISDNEGQEDQQGYACTGSIVGPLLRNSILRRRIRPAPATAPTREIIEPKRVGCEGEVPERGGRPLPTDESKTPRKRGSDNEWMIYIVGGLGAAAGIIVAAYIKRRYDEQLYASEKLRERRDDDLRYALRIVAWLEKQNDQLADQHLRREKEDFLRGGNLTGRELPESLW